MIEFGIVGIINLYMKNNHKNIVAIVMWIIWTGVGSYLFTAIGLIHNIGEYSFIAIVCALLILLIVRTE